MSLKRNFELIDLTNDEDETFDEAQINQFEVMLKDLPNELLLRIMKDRNVNEYLKLMQTSQTLMKRFESINEEMFRYYLKKEFDETVPALFDARTAYLMRRAKTKFRYVYVCRSTFGNRRLVDQTIITRKFFKSVPQETLSDVYIRVFELLQNNPKIKAILSMEEEEDALYGDDEDVVQNTQYTVVISETITIDDDKDDILTGTLGESRLTDVLLRLQEPDL